MQLDGSRAVPSGRDTFSLVRTPDFIRGSYHWLPTGAGCGGRVPGDRNDAWSVEILAFPPIPR